MLLGFDGAINRRVVLPSRYRYGRSETYLGMAAVAWGVLLLLWGFFLLAYPFLRIPIPVVPLSCISFVAPALRFSFFPSLAE